MTRKLLWDSGAWEDYLYWQANDKKLLKKINLLIKECLRTPFEGTGKPEQLKGNLSKAWSRRVNQEHRLVYAPTKTDIRIISCRFHYEK